MTNEQLAILLAAVFWWLDWHAALWFLCGFTVCEVFWWHEHGLRLRAEEKLAHAELAAQTLKLQMAVSRFGQLMNAEKLNSLTRQVDAFLVTLKATKDRRLRDRVTAKVLTMVKSKQVH